MRLDSKVADKRRKQCPTTAGRKYRTCGWDGGHYIRLDQREHCVCMSMAPSGGKALRHFDTAKQQKREIKGWKN